MNSIELDLTLCKNHNSKNAKHTKACSRELANCIAENCVQNCESVFRKSYKCIAWFFSRIVYRPC